MFLENKEELANSNKLKDNTSLQYQKKIEEACVKLLNPHGKVLQFGYSYGYASKLITSFRIDELIIIEPIKEVFQKAKEWSKNNVLINNLRIGVTNTKIHNKINKGLSMKKRLDLIPAKRMAEPSEVADYIVFLISDKNTYITGQTLSISGGE